MGKQTVIVSLGGSLVAPNGVDAAFLKAFKNAVEKHLKTHRFIIIVGGGKPARDYQAAMREFAANDKALDEIGIQLTRVNAALLCQVFGSKALREIITDPTKQVGSAKAILLAGGYKPGFSTDYVSALMAKTWGARSIVNLTNVDYVYDKNPKEFSDAKPIEKLAWSEFKKIVGTKWTPGMNAPFDPRAAKLAERLGITVAVINGSNLEAFENFLSGNSFNGSVIG